MATTNLPFEQWTEVLGSERLTGATLDRLTRRCQIIETKGESYRLKDAKARIRAPGVPDEVSPGKTAPSEPPGAMEGGHRTVSIPLGAAVFDRTPSRPNEDIWFEFGIPIVAGRARG